MGELGFIGGSGLPCRVNNQASTHTPSGNRGSSRPDPRPDHRPAQAQPLSNPGVPAVDTGTQPPKPLSITGCPAGHWTNTWPPGQSRDPVGPPRGGVGAPQGMRNPFTFLGQNTHPQFTPSSPPVHHRPPPSPPIPPTTHTWLIEVNKGCTKVSIGCLAVGLYVSASAVQNP